MLDPMESNTNTFDLQTLYHEERTRWLKTEAPRLSLRELLAASVPWWIVIVGVGLYLLSAPHTAGVFENLTPGWGYVAPTSVEFGLLYAAFRRRLVRVGQETMPPMLNTLQILFFATAVLVNTAGAFSAVVQSADIGNLSFAAVVSGFGTFPATTQASLIMAVMAGWIVPVGALAAGEGVAYLILQRREGGFKESHWREVRFEILYRAVFTRLNGTGLPAHKARKLALAEVSGFLAAQVSTPTETARSLPVSAPEPVPEIHETPPVSEPVNKPVARKSRLSQPKPPSGLTLESYLQSVSKPAREITVSDLMQAGVSRATAYRWLAIIREQSL